MILVVDDVPDSAAVLSRLLQLRGYASEYALSGTEALQWIRGFPKDSPLLVVLDVMMPDLSGIQVVQALRADPATARTPVVMFSAGVFPSQRSESRTLGVLDWIVKGHDFDKVVADITSHYERLGGTRELLHVPRADEAVRSSSL